MASANTPTMATNHPNCIRIAAAARVSRNIQRVNGWVSFPVNLCLPVDQPNNVSAQVQPQDSVRNKDGRQNHQPHDDEVHDLDYQEDERADDSGK